MALALVLPTRNRGSRAQTPILTIEHQHFYVQMTQARPKPCRGQILEIWEPGNPEIWNPKTYKKYKLSKSKSMSSKMSARSGLAGNKLLPAPFRAIFSMDQKDNAFKTVDDCQHFASLCVDLVANLRISCHLLEPVFQMSLLQTASKRSNKQLRKNKKTVKLLRNNSICLHLVSGPWRKLPGMA